MPILDDYEEALNFAGSLLPAVDENMDTKNCENTSF